MMPRRTTLAIALAAVAGLLAACGGFSGSDKAGGVPAPVTLRIAAHKEHDYFATLFTDEVRRLSKGRIHIESIPGEPDNDPPDASVRYARQVRDGRYDLGVIDAPAWDKLGVTSLEPLQAPLLITDQATFAAVLASPLANTMLAGVKAQHVVGLSLIMTWLQHPHGYGRRLTKPQDFRGKRILVPVSRVNDAFITALGATPVHLSVAQTGTSIFHHAIDGQLLGSFGPPHAWLTPNVTFSADAVTVIANERRFGRLSGDQQQILRSAAARAAKRAAAVILQDREADMARRYCDEGAVVLASQADLAALEQAARPVYAQLERDPHVKATIAAIRELKRRTQPDHAPRIPASCSRGQHIARPRLRDSSFLDGTYRWRITRAGALRRGGDPHDPVVGTVATMTLRGGAWALGVGDGPNDHGTFTVVGDRIAFDWPRVGYTNTFTFKRGADGTLDLEPVLPMEVGDRVVLSSSPLTRIGPPVRRIR
jgi:TRAP-type C4-dicarboxylate transport system substrate-binding protein